MLSPETKVKRQTYYEANKDAHKARMKAWRAANPEKVKEMQARAMARRKANPGQRKIDDAKYRERNAEKVKASKERYRLANLEKVAAAKVKWRKENPEKLRAAQLRWDKNNPDKKQVHRENRRCREKDAPGQMSSDIGIKLFEAQSGKCAICRVKLGEKYELDHIVPLILGGGNEDGNIQLLCVTCNRSKGKKHPVDFMQSRGFLL